MQDDLSARILQTQPIVRPAPVGWLAVSEPSAPYRVGVTASSEEEVRERFRDEMRAWALLHDAPEPIRRGET